MSWNQASTIFNFISKNYQAGAMSLVLTYDKKEKPDMKTAKKHLQIFIRKIRNKLKDKSYLAVTTMLRNGRIHHHVILNDINVKCLDDIFGLWEYGAQTTLISPKDGFLILSEYLAKDNHVEIVHSKYLDTEETS